MPQTDAEVMEVEVNPVVAPSSNALDWQAINAKIEAGEIVKFNLGSMPGRPRPGFIDIDRCFGTEAYPLQVPDESITEIVASHILEHFGQNEVGEVLKHWASKLKPGGVMRIAVPNLTRVFEAYKNNERVPVMSFIFGGQTDDNDYHKVGFDDQLLRSLLIGVGLEDIRNWESEIDDCAKSLGSFSLNLSGRKPAVAEIKQLDKVGGILVSARFGPTIHHTCIQRAIAQLPGMKCNIMIGCFWWMQMCEGMEKHMNDGMEYVLTFDYDSVFNPSDVVELYRLLQIEPKADAVTALQCRRGGREVLFSLIDSDSAQVGVNEFSERMLPIKTGHFGLTMFRASSLKTFTKPWMLPAPGPDGSWDEHSGKTDPDISFWHRWREQGKTLYLANRVPIGHVEEMVKLPSMTGDPIYMTIQEWSEKGKPAGVWI